MCYVTLSHLSLCLCLSVYVCLSACLSVFNALTFLNKILDPKSSFFGKQIHLQNLQAKFVSSRSSAKDKGQSHGSNKNALAGGLPSIESYSCSRLKKALFTVCNVIVQFYISCNMGNSATDVVNYISL